MMETVIDMRNDLNENIKINNNFKKYCSVCLHGTNDNSNWRRHVESAKHLQRCTKAGVTITYNIDTTMEKKYELIEKENMQLKKEIMELKNINTNTINENNKLKEKLYDKIEQENETYKQREKIIMSQIKTINKN